jgi:hypothetical protein
VDERALLPQTGEYLRDFCIFHGVSPFLKKILISLNRKSKSSLDRRLLNHARAGCKGQKSVTWVCRYDIVIV